MNSNQQAGGQSSPNQSDQNRNPVHKCQMGIPWTEAANKLQAMSSMGRTPTRQEMEEVIKNACIDYASGWEKSCVVASLYATDAKKLLVEILNSGLVQVQTNERGDDLLARIRTATQVL